MHADELDFRLPPELIAQHAAEPRDSSRLLVCDRASGAVRHRLFADVLDELRDDDLLVVNQTRVRPARVPALRETGGAAEVLLLEPREDGLWLALVRPYRRLREGETVSAGELRLTIHERLGEGRVLVWPEAPRPLDEMLDLVGQMPLPPYITEPLADPARYQTVYADQPGSAAAPTAGLHFTPGAVARRPAAATRSRPSPWTSAWTPSGRSPPRWSSSTRSTPSATPCPSPALA